MFKKSLKILLWTVIVLLAVPLLINGIVIAVALPRVRTPEKAPQAQAVLVLGAGVWANRQLSPMLRDRVDQAIALYEAGKAPKLLMSGDHSSPYYNEVSTMKRYAVDKGVASSDVFLDHSGFSTYESVLRARDIFGVDRVIIVTQRYHLYRALFIARVMGMDAYGVPANPQRYAKAEQRETREFLARIKDFIQVWLPVPIYGEKVDLSGDGDITDTP